MSSKKKNGETAQLRSSATLEWCIVRTPLTDEEREESGIRAEAMFTVRLCAKQNDEIVGYMTPNIGPAVFAALLQQGVLALDTLTQANKPLIILPTAQA